ncbi:hypothetical protein DP113_29330 [Brasilonema octagenarum UFV-E1]|uniref:Uncharacterized protein n=1 Tax=Brasilonema sennae CENA114 TaxID=415709 RepID=A0A856MLK4_9CYAN|nr:hypothetical protein DP114_29135 [Brasilonema sennae CENA114]QDL17812.1 hypothetical protein DP113_29330 [Brasilonema octagenarum UFV-E1]
MKLLVQSKYSFLSKCFKDYFDKSQKSLDFKNLMHLGKLYSDSLAVEEEKSIFTSFLSTN